LFNAAPGGLSLAEFLHIDLLRNMLYLRRVVMALMAAFSAGAARMVKEKPRDAVKVPAATPPHGGGLLEEEGEKELGSEMKESAVDGENEQNEPSPLAGFEEVAYNCTNWSRPDLSHRAESVEECARLCTTVPPYDGGSVDSVSCWAFEWREHRVKGGQCFHYYDFFPGDCEHPLEGGSCKNFWFSRSWCQKEYPGGSVIYNSQAKILPELLPKSFLSYIERADLVRDLSLSNQGCFTVYAPTDEAFKRMPAGMLDLLLQSEHRAQLVAMLKMHIRVGGTCSPTYTMPISNPPFSSTVRFLNPWDFNETGFVELHNTAEGEWTLYPKSGHVDLGDCYAMAGSTKATLRQGDTTDIAALNGVIHLVDNVLLPPSAMFLQTTGFYVGCHSIAGDMPLPTACSVQEAKDKDVGYTPYPCTRNASSERVRELGEKWAQLTGSIFEKSHRCAALCSFRNGACEGWSGFAIYNGTQCVCLRKLPQVRSSSTKEAECDQRDQYIFYSRPKLLQETTMTTTATELPGDDSHASHLQFTVALYLMMASWSAQAWAT